MAEYHVACGAFGIYAGTLNSKNRNMWQNKSEVTQEALKAVAQFLLDRNAEMSFDYEGKRYRLCVLVLEAPKEEEENV